MRCPHCAYPKAAPPVCRACGSSLDTPPVHPVLPELEVTRQAPAEVVVTPLPGVETTAHAQVEADAGGQLAGLEHTRYAPAGDVPIEPLPDVERIASSSEAAVVEPARGAAERGLCPRCGRGVEAGDTACGACGAALVAKRKGNEDVAPLRCLSCSTPNPPTRAVCMACGKRL